MENEKDAPAENTPSDFNPVSVSSDTTGQAPMPTPVAPSPDITKADPMLDPVAVAPVDLGGAPDAEPTPAPLPDPVPVKKMSKAAQVVADLIAAVPPSPIELAADVDPLEVLKARVDYLEMIIFEHSNFLKKDSSYRGQ